MSENTSLSSVIGSLLFLGLISCLEFFTLGLPYIITLFIIYPLLSAIALKKPIAHIYQNLDWILLKGEKLILTLSLLAMTAVIFLDILWRLSKSSEMSFGLTFFSILALLLIITTMKHAYYEGRRKFITIIIFFFVIIISCYLLIHFIPNGFGWAQKLGLVLFIWAAFIGVSLATRERRHINIEVIQKFLPEKIKKMNQKILALIFLITFGILYFLSYHYTLSQYIEWKANEFKTAVFLVLPLPYFSVTVIIPMICTSIIFRIILQDILNIRLKEEKYDSAT